jgi:hypothetical protein
VHWATRSRRCASETGAIFVVTDTAGALPAPARLDDALSVTVDVREAGRASMLIAQQAWRAPTCSPRGRIRIGCVDAASLRPRRIPIHLPDHSPACTHEPGPLHLHARAAGQPGRAARDGGLLLTSLASWTVIFGKLFGLRKVRGATRTSSASSGPARA